MTDGQTIICGCEDRKIRLFLLPQARLEQYLDVGSGEVFQVAVANWKDYFASVADDGVLSLLRPSDLSVIGRLHRDRDYPRDERRHIAGG
jgi:hypothetical protein